jgi:hypothetical protein
MSTTQLRLVWTEHNNFDQIVNSFDFRYELNLDDDDIYCGEFEPDGSVTFNGRPIEVIHFKDFSYDNKKISFSFPGGKTITKFIVSETLKKDPVKFTIIPPSKQHYYFYI